ncbi:hypothetical protein LTS12_018164 [Elasticomyces elasticus]|nr:hypothetical protein LTS12_018164 [Elasticomyces elasticus]
MGLPIWRDPEEKAATKDAIKTDPTAAARSSIRRRPSIHGRRSARPRLTRDTTIHSPRTQPPSSSSARYTYEREPASSSTRSGVPPISTLLESADRHSNAPPPPPVPESRNYYTERELGLLSGHLRDGPSSRSLEALQDAANRLERQTSIRRDRLLQNRLETGALRNPTSTVENRRSRGYRELPLPITRPAASEESVRVPRSLPTPPLDLSDIEGDSLFMPEVQTRSGRGSHPLRNSWSPDSPVDGLGDRNRSPTPADHWEIMRSTITPDATLPSADSSFTSAAASQSFASAHDTTTTEPERGSSSSTSRRESSDDEASSSVSSVDPEDLVCDDENDRLAGADSMAEFMFDFEEVTAEGRLRIAEMREIRDREGNRFALAHESARIDIGFRLIEDALESEEGRERLIEIGVLAHGEDPNEPLILQDPEEPRRRHLSLARTRRTRTTDDDPPPRDPTRYREGPHTAEASAQIHEFFRRETADSLHSRSLSPPSQYQPLASHPDVETFTSREEPQAQPVSPPIPRARIDGVDALMSGDETDLGAMRGIVERLARRDDVPEEWWSSIGLNLSRTRARARSPPSTRTEGAASGRVRARRIERRNSRL